MSRPLHRQVIVPEGLNVAPAYLGWQSPARAGERFKVARVPARFGMTETARVAKGKRGLVNLD
jgi:hypothetical protein